MEKTKVASNATQVQHKREHHLRPFVVTFEENKGYVPVSLQQVINNDDGAINFHFSPFLKAGKIVPRPTFAAASG